MEEQDRFKWIYSSKDKQELTERYDQWASNYDTELEEVYGWRSPRIAAEFVNKYVSKDGRILDAGAGTGLVGCCLHKLGYTDLLAIDLSEEMLRKARNKKVYKKLHQMDLGETLNFPDDAFDAVVCVGVLTYGHAPASSLREMIRVTKPGGHIVFSLRTDAYEPLGFKVVQAALESAGNWKLVEISDPHQAFARKDLEALHRIWVYQVR
jgi:predicted TPR repeat methyltransferase